MDSRQRPDVAAELSRLKDFQRRTVERVHQRLWLDEDYTKRFLVADEVGLGKTLVARGVIARTIDHLWDSDTVDRIDIVYICSNSQIAAQNLRRLNVGGETFDHADRLTLLPTAVKNLQRNKVNFVSFTPGTSFQISESGGRVEERVLLHHMLSSAWGRKLLTRAGWVKFFQGAVRRDRYEGHLSWFDPRSIDPTVIDRFAVDLEEAHFQGAPFPDVLKETVGEYSRLRSGPRWQLSRRRYRLIGQMRHLVAAASVEALEPDLVILDEFQRFKDLLDPGNPGADLAHAIFDHTTSRVLLLSATPFKMYTLPDEPEGDDHYKDFLKTVGFLGGESLASTVGADLRAVRDVVRTSGDPHVGRESTRRVQDALAGVMCRTERLAATPDRDGMLNERELPGLGITADDVRAYRALQRVARLLDQPDVFEYWRSSPYIFNLMDGYQVKDRLKRAIDDETPGLAEALAVQDGALSWEDVSAYKRIDPGNGKLRALASDVFDRGSWRVAWVPPSLPYYTPSGPFADPALAGFTKRLVFSAWNVVPKAISVLLSYEAERRAADEHRGGRAQYEQRVSPLLRFQESSGRLSGMPLLALLYPSITLASLGDPWQIAQSLGVIPADQEAVLDVASSRTQRALAGLPPGDVDGPVDQRWYWAAPFLLDRAADPNTHKEFLDVMASWGDSDDEDTGSRLQQHVREAARVTGDSLGRRPDDLAEVLALLALAGPGVCALRALGRVSGGTESWPSASLRDDASHISWGLRSLFNRPEVMAFVRRRAEAEDEAYWRHVLQHCLSGNLQAVLDEYAHVLIESEGLQDHLSDERADRLSEVMTEALTIRTAAVGVDEIVRDAGLALRRHRARVHYAMRFGRTQTETGAVQRESQVRTAFNSPFWPFVLSSTSVGQEGLDFHTYSHAVVHWNLPGNPVDLEQREGRVHRYKGHAVRRNVADAYGSAALHATVDDPWFAMFLAAAEERPDGESEMYPFWVFSLPGGAVIERYVPAMPLSRETARYARLQRTVGAYRMVMGQPRQQDLLRYAGPDVADWHRIDLTPP